MEYRELKLIKNLDGHGTINYKICLPTKWIKKLNLEKEEKVVVCSTDTSIIIINKEEFKMKEKYYTVENGVKQLTWIARDIKTKEVVKEFANMTDALKYVNENENTELYDRTTKKVWEFERRNYDKK